MDASEDFVVVNEKGGAEREALNRLQTLIDLLSNSLDTLNQSNLLLKDELRSALSVTLQYCPTHLNINTEEIVKSLEANVTSPEDVRANYVRTLCSKLVTVDRELNDLRTENENLKNSLQQKEKENLEQLEHLSSTVKRLERITKTWKTPSSSDQPRPATPETNADDSTEPLSLSQLQSELDSIALRIMDADASVRASSSTYSTERHSVEVQVSTDHTEVGSPIQEDNVPSQSRRNGPVIPELTPFLSVNPFFEGEWPSSVSNTRDQPSSFLIEANRISTSAFPAIRSGIERLMYRLATNPKTAPQTHVQQQQQPQVEQSPTFHAHDEEPWCPSCSQHFASREDLEDHLQACLQ